MADIKEGVNIFYKMCVILTFAKLCCQVCMLKCLSEFEKSFTLLCLKVCCIIGILDLIVVCYTFKVYLVA